MVLRAVVAAYVADAVPASSAVVSHLLPVPLSSASIRNTMVELSRLGLIEKPHSSAGRVPTELGLRQFLDRLLGPAELADYERRLLERSFEDVEGEAIMYMASQLLSERTRQLGFALAPNVERMKLRHVSLVRVARDRVLVVLVPQMGPVQQCVIEEAGQGDQAELDRIASTLNERMAGHTLAEMRGLLELELRDLRSRAGRLLARALSLGLRVVSSAHPIEAKLVIASRRALLSQPEFEDPDRIRGVFAAVETNERLIEVLTSVLEGQEDAVSVSLGEDLEEPGLRQCALVAVPYGGATLSGREFDGVPTNQRAARHDHLGVLGVIGPSRMDYARIIPLVGYCSQLVTEKLNA